MADQESRHKAEEGFTLIECLVALSIVALSLAAILGIFAASGQRARSGQQLAEAALVAQSLLARAGSELPLQPGSLRGNSVNGQRWQLLIEQLPDAGSQAAVTAYKISARISWREANSERSVALTTLRLAPTKAMP